MDIESLYRKYKDIIPYGIFGVLTTLVNVAVYWLAAHQLRLGVMSSTVIAWILAVLFAYITNRKWVFHSEAKTASEIWREMLAFFSCRLATGILDWGCMYVFVDVMNFDDVLIKVAANILVIILNYVASKLVIFNGKGKKG